MGGERERLRNLTLSTSHVWIIPGRSVPASKVCTSQWLIIIYVVFICFAMDNIPQVMLKVVIVVLTQY